MSGTTITSSGTAALLLAAEGSAPVTIASGVSIILSGSVAAADNSLTSAAYGGPGAVWILLNEGILEANATLASGTPAGVGLYLAGAGSVTNGLAGVIEGNAAGLALLAGGNVLNRGTISGGIGASNAGLARVGVQLGGGTVENDGLIQGGAYGVSLGAAGLVTNNGQIAGGAVGAVLATGGSLANAAGATITGGAAGAVLRAGASLTNAGSIGASIEAAGHQGVLLGSGAYLVNRGSISGFNGVWGASGTATLMNEGWIGSGGSLALPLTSTGYSFFSGAAVELTSATVINRGVIQGNNVPPNALMQAGSAGSGLVLGAGTLTNLGTLAGGGGANATHGGLGLAGAAQLAGYNAGLIEGGTGTYGGAGAMLFGGSLLNTGNILGGDGVVSGGDGVVLNNGATLVNQGQITGGIGPQYLWNVGLGAGVALYSGLLENQGALSGGGQQLMGLWMGGGQAVNTGTIIGHAAVAMEGGTLENTGLISGTALGVDLAGGSFLNQGTVAGSYAVYMAHAGAVLGVAAGAVFEGKVTGHAGGATLQLTGTTPGTLDMGTSFSGFSEISFAAGSDWSLAGGVTQLAGGETISGFAGSDTLLLEGFTASSESFVSGAGLVLGEGSASVTLDVQASAPLLVNDVAQGTEIVICYRRGTMIQTMRGERDVADLRIGDALPTRFGGVRRIKWIGWQRFGPKDLHGNRDRIPVCIQPGALGQGLPHRALFVSPGHSMLLGGVLVLARSLVNGVNITQGYDGEEVEYFLPEFETHDCLLAEGAWSESFADGPGLRRHFQNRAEFDALFKTYREPSEILLCAPRPLQGMALERALRPVIGGLGQPEGTLRGCIDIADGRLAEGWAQDIAWPFLPQALEFFGDGQKLGEALACHFREDLAREGIGAGRAAFSFIAPRRFNPARLTIRRAGDGAETRSALGSQPSTSASGRSMPRVFSVCHTPSAV
ncbi:MAG: Hint domain-containing protein [Rhodospirillales bacterium]|nr:Hint domain-containing protein [Rhodospirillales bacterium]